MTPEHKQTLLDLAERCEQATGPDRELDGRVWWEFVGRHQGWAEKHDDWRSGCDYYWGKGSPCGICFTASLDAAMTLVPEGWDGALYLATDTHKPEVQLETPAMRSALSLDDERAEGSAATLPLALCAAALRAQAAS